MSTTLADVPPPDAARPPRPTAPPRALVLAGCVGVVAAALPSGPPGIGLVLLVAVAGWLLVRTAGARLRGWQGVHAAAALALLSTVAVRDAPWLVALVLVAAAGAACLALVPARSWAGVLAAPLRVVGTLPAAVAWLGRGARAAVPRSRRSGPALRGLALTTAVLAVFVPLLVSADAAFATVLTAVLPDLPSTESLPPRLVAGAAAAVAAGAALMLLVWPRQEPSVPPPSRRAGTAEWLPPLLGLNLLLAGFLAVQASVLLGGADHVLRTAGVTYSSYLHQGFWQLVVVTALVLAVVAAGARWAPAAARPLLGGLCVLALLVDASAFSRLQLYVEAYGLTRLRLLVGTVVLELAVVLLLVLVAGLVARPAATWLPHVLALSCCVALLALSAADPDARIARSALDRADRADLAYLATLSADAVPALDRLPEPQRSCVLRRVDEGPWTSWNLARHRAADLLERRPPVACGGG